MTPELVVMKDKFPKASLQCNLTRAMHISICLVIGQLPFFGDAAGSIAGVVAVSEAMPPRPPEGKDDSNPSFEVQVIV